MTFVTLMPFMGSVALQAMAPQDEGLGWNGEANPLCVEDPVAAASSPATEGDVEERRLRRKISNRESARRSRARKQRRLDDLRAMAARLRGCRRELASCARSALDRAALVRLANAALRAEAAALNRRLEAARRHALALNQLYAAAAEVETTSFEQTIASLISCEAAQMQTMQSCTTHQQKEEVLNLQIH